MEPELQLAIRTNGTSPGRIPLALSVLNRSARTLLIPVPEITGFRFKRIDDATRAEWYTRMLQHGRWHGVVLPPSGRHDVTYSIVACSDRKPDTCEDLMNERFDRWCVDLRPGDYDVTYVLRVAEDYFDGDSHSRLPDLRFEAESKHAEVWLGEAVSNPLRVAHAAK